MRLRNCVAILLLLLAAPSFAEDRLAWSLVGTLAAPAGGGGETYIYAGESSDNYPDVSSTLTVRYGGSFTTTDAITITKIGVKISDAQLATQGWVGIYTAEATGSKLITGTIDSPVVGWNDVSVSYPLSASTTYTIWSHCNSGYKLNVRSAGSGPAYYSNGAYDVGGPDTIARSTDSGSGGYRIGY